MVHRRTVFAIIALLALVFLFSSPCDSLAGSFLGERTSRAQDECVALSRSSGSMIAVTGDPDELATGSGGDEGGGLGAIGWIRFNGWDSEPGSGGVSNAVVDLIMCWLYLGEIEQTY